MKRIAVRKTVVGSTMPPANKNVVWKDNDGVFNGFSDGEWKPLTGGSGSGNFIKLFVDAYMKQYTNDAINDDVVVATKYNHKVGVCTSPITGYAVNANLPSTDRKLAFDDYELTSLSDYTDTLSYLNGIKSNSISITDIYSSSISNLICASCDIYSSKDVHYPILYVPNYGMISNTIALLTSESKSADSDAIAFFPYINIVYNTLPYTLPLFIFDKFNQSLGGTAIDWSNVFPTNGVRYKDL